MADKRTTGTKHQQMTISHQRHPRNPHAQAAFFSLLCSIFQHCFRADPLSSAIAPATGTTKTNCF
jgi:hypothetical protein